MRNLVLISLFFIGNFIFAQNFTAQVVDSKKNAIPFATVQFGEHSGVITNEEGYFNILLSEVKSDGLTFSCMGFSSKTISVETIITNNNIVVLDEFINELGKVYLSSTTPNADVIIQKVNNNLVNNYQHQNQSYNFFSRNTNYVEFDNLNFDVTKASGMRKKQHIDVNASLDSLTQSIKNSNTVYFQDILGDLMVEDKENAKLNVQKVTSLLDMNNNFSLENVQERAQHLILKYLDTTKTYKLKTSIIMALYRQCRAEH